MRNSKWLRLLGYVTGSVNQELLLQNEYLAAENRILRTKLPKRLRLSDPERVTLGSRLNVPNVAISTRRRKTGTDFRPAARIRNASYRALMPQQSVYCIEAARVVFFSDIVAE